LRWIADDFPTLLAGKSVEFQVKIREVKEKVV
jgi:FKBP-type peptidyl-prolyl cis-trans isomerase 2